MKPDCDVYLGALVRELAEDLAPCLPGSWEQAAVMRHVQLLPVVRQEFERAAHRRVQENAAIRALFTQALGIVKEPVLLARLQSAATSRDASLLVSELDAGNRALRGLLVDLHASVETLSATASNSDIQSLETAIWHELAASTLRREVTLGRF